MKRDVVTTLLAAYTPKPLALQNIMSTSGFFEVWSFQFPLQRLAPGRQVGVRRIPRRRLELRGHEGSDAFLGGNRPEETSLSTETTGGGQETAAIGQKVYIEHVLILKGPSFQWKNIPNAHHLAKSALLRASESSLVTP